MNDREAKLSDAVILYLGFGSSSWPQANHNGILEKFGPEEGEALSARVRELVEEIGKIPINWGEHSYDSAVMIARATMQARHSELSEIALDALKWKFSYDWK